MMITSKQRIGFLSAISRSKKAGKLLSLALLFPAGCARKAPAPQNGIHVVVTGEAQKSWDQAARQVCGVSYPTEAQVKAMTTALLQANIEHLSRDVPGVFTFRPEEPRGVDHRLFALDGTEIFLPTPNTICPVKESKPEPKTETLKQPEAKQPKVDLAEPLPDAGKPEQPQPNKPVPVYTAKPAPTKQAPIIPLP